MSFVPAAVVEDELKKADEERANGNILETYERMAPFRRVPPPESIAHELLLHIQARVCFMCQCRSKRRLEREVDDRLVEDHDHETGMVRALLCRRCNTSEGSAGGDLWTTYRKFAPANGWYYRYSGHGEQWRPWDPDPLPERMRFSAHCGLDDRVRDPSHYLGRYLEVVKTLPATPIPVTCQRRFDFSKPLLLPGERYISREEMVHPEE